LAGIFCGFLSVKNKSEKNSSFGGKNFALLKGAKNKVGEKISLLTEKLSLEKKV